MTARSRLLALRRLSARRTVMLGPLGGGIALAAMVVPLLFASPALAVTCDRNAATPTNHDPGTVILADNFETGDFSDWSQVVHNYDATAYVSASRHVSGWCAGKLHVTDNGSSRAYVRTWIGWADDVWVSGAFNVDHQGWIPNNVPFFRLWNANGRILDVYRQNGAGNLWLRTANGSGGWSYVKLRNWVSLDSWHSLKIHAHPNWGSSTVEIWFDGAQVYSTRSRYLPTDNLTSVMVGAEHVRQEMDLYFDDIVIKAG